MEPSEPTGGSVWSVFGHVISGTIGAIAMQVVSWGREWRKDTAAVEDTETETAIKVVAVWKQLYDERTKEVEILRKRCDDMQERMDTLETQLHREKRECEANIENLTVRVRELEKGLNFMSPQNPS